MFLLLAFLYRIFHNLIYSNIKNPLFYYSHFHIILPLVALEYGQNAWASSAIFSLLGPSQVLAKKLLKRPRFGSPHLLIENKDTRALTSESDSRLFSSSMC